MILDAIDVDIAPKEIVTLIGPNGSGKTTLVRVLLGLEKPDQGTVRRATTLRIGYVPQRFDIDRAIPMTVERFLALGNGGRQTRIADVLAEVGAPRVISQQLSQLSGGELQRVLLARALLSDPQLLVLDEPVRGVDYTGEADLYALITRLRDALGFGVLLVSHDLHIVMASSDRVICLNRHVCCSGVPETVAQHPEYVRLFGAETARAFAVYRHHHDHRHDLDGETQSGLEPAEASAGRRSAP
jgi:zinc transport system ATP-binding protein